LLMIVALIAPIGLCLHLWNGAGRTMRIIELVRIASWPPEWWTMWWPFALRRPTDLWGRLPLAAKAVRVLISVSFPALLVLILLRGRLSPEAAAIYETWVEIAEWAVVGAGILAFALGFIWARRSGLAVDQSIRLLLGPTLAALRWNEPALTRLLAPASGKVRAPNVDAPADYLRAIREMLLLVPMNAGDTGPSTAATAESVLKAINQRDSELASLARDAGAGEAERLASQLDSLDTGGTGDPRDRAELRELVRHQLDLVRSNAEQARNRSPRACASRGSVERALDSRQSSRGQPAWRNGCDRQASGALRGDSGRARPSSYTRSRSLISYSALEATH
ncbi:MAG: hypothetical protein ABI681_09300, partial [Gemmatimonadales bacterium]